MSLFDYEDYRRYVRDRLKAMPRRGHGQYRQMALLLDIHTTMVTHIFKGDAHLSVEHALKLAEHFAFSSLETDYFVTLVQLARASNVQSRRYFGKILSDLKTRSLNLAERLQVKKVLDERDQAMFYSAWYFSGIRLLVATGDFRSPEAVAESLGLSMKTVARALEFLLSTDLVRLENGRYRVGEAKTYVTRDSPLVSKHHLNWRLKSIEMLENIPDGDLSFTNSIALSEKDFQKIREEIVKLLETYKEIGDPSPPETVCFLTIDWRHLLT
jgi:uncharacterized protein (TIGR02147 family)